MKTLYAQWEHEPPMAHEVVRQIKAMGVGFGACHTEYVVTPNGPRLIEINYRFERANAEILVTIMIEDRAGVENLPQILSVPGIDMVLEGAVDLSQSYAVPGQFTHPLVLQAVQQIADTCRANQVPFCAVPRNQEQFHAWQAQGVQAFLLGDDRGLAFKAFKSHVESYRAATGGAR